MTDVSHHKEPVVRAGRAEWRRTVVVFADLVESVRLTNQFESDLLDRWRRFRDVARDQVLPATGGRLVRTTGDGLLIEASSPAASVDLSFALHDALAGFNHGCEAEQAMQLRIGVHVADVIVEEHDLQGAGVNLAARLCSLGQAGQTVVSAALREGLVDSLHAHVTDLGERYVKGLDEPVRAFLLRQPGAVSGGDLRVPLPSPHDLRPGVIIVPFEGGEGDAEHQALGHVMSDDIIANLARHPGLRVLSRHSAAALKGHLLDPAWTRKTLDASFLVTGRYHVMGQRVRVSVELCELRQSEVLWADRFLTTVDALFDGHDRLVPQVVARVAEQVSAHELTRVRHLPMDALPPYTLYLGAEGLIHSLVRRDFELARTVLEGLTERHPRQPAPYALLARWHVFRFVQGWGGDRAADGRQAQAWAARALELDGQQPVALACDGLVRMNFHDDVQGARERYLAALAADPGEAHAWTNLSAVHSLSGEHDQACEAALQALTVSPLDPNRFLFDAFAAMAHVGAGRFEQAIHHARDSLRYHALHAPSHRLLVAALALAGRLDEARLALHDYLGVHPKASVGPRWRHLSGPQPVWESRFAEALLEVGLPA